MDNIKYKLKKIGIVNKSKKNNKKYSEELYEKAFGKKINWQSPEEFNEKLMYLKVFNYNKNPLVKECTDKYGMRMYALNKGIKEKHLEEIVGIYKSVKEIKIGELPEKFIIRCTHGEYFNIVCYDKETFNFKEAFAKINKWLKTKYGYDTGEIQYTKIKPQIMITKLTDDYIYDYKLYCFYGKPLVILVTSRENEDLKLNFYDYKWNELLLEDKKYHGAKIKAPRYLNDMLGIAKKVSKEFPFVRINFHEENGKTVMDNMVFTPSACLANYYRGAGNSYLSKLLDLKI